MQRLLIGFGLLVVLTIAAGFFARVVLHGPVGERSLAVSVGLAAGSGLELEDDHDRCVRRPAPRRWDCEVTDADARGTVTYRVAVRRHTSCWRARRLGRGGGMPRRVEGCVHVWQW
jgi:hypothetical protein